jgi:hypothetical protein
MFWFIAQILDFVIYNNLHLFLVFCTYVWFVFFTKYYFARVLEDVLSLEVKYEKQKLD